MSTFRFMLSWTSHATYEQYHSALSHSLDSTLSGCCCHCAVFWLRKCLFPKRERNTSDAQASLRVHVNKLRRSGSHHDTRSSLGYGQPTRLCFYAFYAWDPTALFADFRLSRLVAKWLGSSILFFFLFGALPWLDRWKG